MQKEHIICAAVHFHTNKQHEEQPTNIESGLVVAGRRHSDCYMTVINLVGADFLSDFSERDEAQVQGFITSTNRFVDRSEAWQIAEANNQIIYGYEASNDGDDSILISENLY